MGKNISNCRWNLNGCCRVWLLASLHKISFWFTSRMHRINLFNNILYVIRARPMNRKGFYWNLYVFSLFSELLCVLHHVFSTSAYSLDVVYNNVNIEYFPNGKNGKKWCMAEERQPGNEHKSNGEKLKGRPYGSPSLINAFQKHL